MFMIDWLFYQHHFATTCSQWTMSETQNVFAIIELFA